MSHSLEMKLQNLKGKLKGGFEVYRADKRNIDETDSAEDLNSIMQDIRNALANEKALQQT